jgi:hypothetical protein
MRMRLPAFFFLSAFLAAGLAGRLAALPKPASVTVSTAGPAPVIRWGAAEGASFYRVAVFGAPDDEGKRPLMAAVWIKGLSWTYGSKKVASKLGKLPSTPPKPLEPGGDYKVMVSAADGAGADKSDWASAEFSLPVAPLPAPARQGLSEITATPTPPEATATPTPTLQADANGNSGPAELEVDLASEIKETPEAGETGLSPAAATGAPATLEGARALLQAGKADQAAEIYKALLDKDASNADYWEGLGDSYDAQFMKVEAKEAYEKALAIDKTRLRLRKWLDENVKR